MACLEHEVLEHVALVHKDMVNTHRTEVDAVILMLRHACFEPVQFHRQIFLPLFKPLLHLSATPTKGALFQGRQATLHIHELLQHDVVPRLV